MTAARFALGLSSGDRRAGDSSLSLLSHIDSSHLKMRPLQVRAQLSNRGIWVTRNRENHAEQRWTITRCTLTLEAHTARTLLRHFGGREHSILSMEPHRC